MEDDKTPKVFISYSWSSDELVLDLAKRLVAHGVDVVLDKWDLKEGKTECVNGIRMLPQYVWIKGLSVVEELKKTPEI